MKPGKLRRLRRRLDELRSRRGVRRAELERLARAVGRKRHPRGKEPTWISTLLPNARPLSISSHPGDLNRHTARAILDQLESDIDALQETLVGSVSDDWFNEIAERVSGGSVFACGDSGS